ncbi:DUF2637 domain-containing protein [Streptomyces sp. NPDC059506]|uniref:DUF2637 domain-containing protein n=1 Tax=unclassified Streptomyces TaxID=2593676 RepID=UPI000CBE6637|nr:MULTISPECIES: DUF2637 domain-containing protein [unclassified Streptomyces]MCZ2526004.1 DUF2637 domain-containing protein [Streptomyces sp. HB2AG]PLW72195.1 SpdA protein [Streptomyces sp. DJ]QMV22988.1 DUF2637 domain-containing protein [Streptomyces sp. SCUT-3]
MRALLARVDAVLVQAAIAAALSFAHLHDLAHAAGQEGWKAWAYPVSVDLLMVAAWRRLRSGTDRAAAWCWFLIALAASLGANVATAGLLDLNHVPAWLRILVAGWPALAFLGGSLLAHSATAPALAKSASQPIPSAPVLPAPVPEPAPVESAHPVREPVPVLASKAAGPPAPELPEPEPQTAEPEAVPEPTPEPSRPAVRVPVALVEHARKVADGHRARTGSPIDTPTLRARLGVPEPLAEAIAAQI